ncbi:MAG: translation initiation factor IF-2 [Candidatus Woesearchaeota archaeon]
MTTRSPIAVVVGHVDHGKSSILDYIRSTNIVSKEAGAITQAIGASTIPISIISAKCQRLIDTMNLKFTIPGLLFIDTPGHAAFSSLRKRGGSLADIAILVVDMNEGFQPQTIESIKILKESKTPFVVAANKIDRIQSYKTCAQTREDLILKNIEKQTEQCKTLIETKLYEVVQQLYERGFPAERFDRVSDFTKEVAIVPTSAVNGDGMAELLMVVSALAQKFLEKQLQTTADGPARGTVLEVKEKKGQGAVMDAIIYDGTLHCGDTLVIGDVQKPIITKVRGLFLPSTLRDLREQKGAYTSVKSVSAAIGVRIVAPDLEKVVSGMPLCSGNTDEATQFVQKEVACFNLDLQKEGIIIKADTLGSLEALHCLLAQLSIPVRVASVGAITKKDILEAQANVEAHPEYGIILGFNIDAVENVPKDIRIFTAPVIYKLIDEYVEYKKEKEQEKHKEDMAKLATIGKAKFLPGCAFRQNNPAIFGMEILSGELKPKMQLIKKDGSRVGSIKALQENKEVLSKATKDMQVACAIENITIGRQIHEGEIYYSALSESEYLRFKEFKNLLTPEQKELLQEIAAIYRELNPVWGLDD